MKTCLWCANPCPDYFNSIAPKCNELLGQDACQLRQYMAEMCDSYKPAEQQFETYSNGEPYYG